MKNAPVLVVMLLLAGSLSATTAESPAKPPKTPALTRAQIDARIEFIQDPTLLQQQMAGLGHARIATPRFSEDAQGVHAKAGGPLFPNASRQALEGMVKAGHKLWLASVPPKGEQGVEAAPTRVTTAQEQALREYVKFWVLAKGGAAAGNIQPQGVANSALQAAYTAGSADLIALSQQLAHFTDLRKSMRIARKELDLAGGGDTVEIPVTRPDGTVEWRPKAIGSDEELQQYKSNLDADIETVGTDMQMWTMKVQEASQALTRTLTMWSSLQKSFHDLSMTIIKNI